MPLHHPSAHENRRGRSAASRRRTALFLFVALASLLVASEASAYIGPGAGFAFLGSFFVFFVTFFVALAALLSWPFRALLRRLRTSRATSRDKARFRRIVVIGFDGMEPLLVERFMDQGRLPALARLRSEGFYRPLRSTLPPLSPVAWSSFQTGVNPGKHGIFDFLHRNPKSYLGELSSVRIRPASRAIEIGRVRIPLGRPSVRLLRKSRSFWEILGERGVFSTILRVPITFPPTGFYGLSLSAMCVPDLRGTQGTFTLFTTRPPERTKTTGGEVVHLEKPTGSKGIRTRIAGPEHPFRNDGSLLTIPLRILPGRDAVDLQVQRARHRVPLGGTSPWIPLAFRADLFRVRGLVRFHLRALEPFLELYMTPIQIDPAAPSLPISHPPSFSIYLANRQGPFATLGLAEDTWALNEGALDDASFLEQCLEIHGERERMFEDALDHLRNGLLVCVFDLTDRVQHMFWRYEDDRHPAPTEAGNERYARLFEEIYQRADRIVGRVMDRLDSDTLLLVMSDHGFRSFRRCFNVNSWLHRQGYLALDPSVEPGEWFRGVDWAKTRAFAVGLAGIYINQRGRERAGIVAPGEETEALKEQIISELRGLTDPETGERPILDVFDTAKAYRGPYAGEAQDLIIGYAEGYRTSWESATGTVTPDIFYDNEKKWSGDHCLTPEAVPGVLFSSHPLRADDPAIVDLAPTILKAFGIDPPGYMDGKALPFGR